MISKVFILAVFAIAMASAGPSGSEMSQGSGAVSRWVDELVEMITGSRNGGGPSSICPVREELDCDMEDQVMPWMGWCYECSDDGYIYAICDLASNTIENDTYTAEGKIVMRQSLDGSSDIEIKASMTNVALTSSQHGFHVHEEADISDGCTGAGSHYNPYNQVHGGPLDEIRHVGDWGNVEASDSGIIEVEMTDPEAALLGPFAIFGRAIVLHAMEDDLGQGNWSDSSTTGHAGARLGCCIVGHADSDVWDEV